MPYVSLFEVGVGNDIPSITAVEGDVLRLETKLGLKEGDGGFLEAHARAFAKRVVNSFAERLKGRINALN
jgi:hypothetical protein